MRNFSLICLCLVLIFSCKKPPVKQPPVKDNTANPAKGTCKVDGVINNFDSTHVSYFAYNKNYEILFFKQGSAVIRIDCSNYSGTNSPSYTFYTNGVGVFNNSNSSSTISPIFSGTFVDLNVSTIGNFQLENGTFEINSHDVLTGLMSGTFTGMSGTVFTSSTPTIFNFTEGRFENIKVYYF